jgi:hypothetical protein
VGPTKLVAQFCALRFFLSRRLLHLLLVYFLSRGSDDNPMPPIHSPCPKVIASAVADGSLEDVDQIHNKIHVGVDADAATKRYK